MGLFFNNKSEKRMSLEEFQKIDWNANYTGASSTDVEFKESTYFKCVKRISDDVAKVPLYLKQTTKEGEVLADNHYLFDLIERPNPYMSQIDFLKAIEAVRQHRGHSGALITRDYKGKVTGLYPVEITRIVIDNLGIAKSKKKNPILVYYRCGQNGQEYSCLYNDILHFKGMSFDGVISTAIKDNLKDTIDTNTYAQSYQKDLFASGLTNKAVVQFMSDIKDEKKLKEAQAMFDRLYTSSKRILTVPAGYQVSPLQLNLSDSQFAELKKMGQIDICTSFGLQPYQIGIMDGYNNNSLEQSNLGYLSNVLLLLFTSIEAEFKYKLLNEGDRKQKYYFEFDENELLRMDSKTQAEVYTKYVQNSILTPNEVRMKLGEKKAEDGDDLLAASGMLKIKDLYKTAKDNAGGGA